MTALVADQECADLLRLAWSRDFWISRRTCQLSFVNEAVIQRDTTCEIDLSNISHLLVTSPGSKLLLPISDVTRTPARNIALFNSNRQQLPHLIRTQEREIAALGLATLTLQSYGTVPGATVGVAASHILHEIDRSYRHPKTTSHAAWLGTVEQQFPELKQLMDEINGTRVVFALAEPNTNTWPFIVCEQHVESLRVHRSTIVGALRVWRNRDKPDVPGMWASWRHHNPKAPFERSLVRSDGSVMRVEHADGDLADAAFRRIWQWPWWVPDTYVLTYPVDDFLHCQSFHLGLEVPDGIYAQSANLRVLNKADGTNEMIIVSDDDLHPDRSHLHFTRRLSQRDAPDEDYRTASLRVILRPTYHNGLRSGALLSLVATTSLWFLFGTIGWDSAGRKCWICLLKLGTFDTNSVVALLVLALSFALGLLARRDEHDLTKRVHGRLRLRLALLSLLLFGVAMITSIKPQGANLFWVLLGASILASLLTAATLLSAAASRHQIHDIMFAGA